MCHRLCAAIPPWSALSPLWLEPSELTATQAPEWLAQIERALREAVSSSWGPNPLLSPMDSALIVRSGRSLGECGDPRDNLQLGHARWGLIPSWASGRRHGERLLVASAAHLEQTPAFRRPLRAQRCVVPLSGYYDWVAASSPWRVEPTRGPIMLAAGLWEQWASPSGELVESFALVSAPAPEALRASGLERSLIAWSVEQARRWLDPQTSYDQALLMVQQALEPWVSATRQALPRLARPAPQATSAIRRAPAQLDMLHQLHLAQRRRLEDRSEQAQLPLA